MVLESQSMRWISQIETERGWEYREYTVSKAKSFMVKEPLVKVK